MACDRNVAWVTFSPAVDQAELLAVLAGARVSPTGLRSNASGAALLLSLANVPDWGDAQAAMTAFDPGATIRRDVARVSVVGSQLTDSPDALLRMRRSLLDAGAEPLDLEVSPLRLTALVPADSADAAQQALHRAFVA